MNHEKCCPNHGSFRLRKFGAIRYGASMDFKPLSATNHGLQHNGAWRSTSMVTYICAS